MFACQGACLQAPTKNTLLLIIFLILLIYYILRCFISELDILKNKYIKLKKINNFYLCMLIFLFISFFYFLVNVYVYFNIVILLLILIVFLLKKKNKIKIDKLSIIINNAYIIKLGSLYTQIKQDN